MQANATQLQLQTVARRVARRLCKQASFAAAAGRGDFAARCYSQAGDMLALIRRR